MRPAWRLVVVTNLYCLIILYSNLSYAKLDSVNGGHHVKKERRPETLSFRRKLILVLVNGFAHYWSEDESRFNLSGFRDLRRHGARATHLKPEFPTLSLPNQYSLLTGLHVGKHGISGDVMYDNQAKTYFVNATQSSDFNVDWWNRTEPVWLTAGKQDVPTKVYWWRGCQVPFMTGTNRKVSVECIPFTDSLGTDTFLNEIPSIIDGLSDDSLQFVLINYEMVDQAAHLNGPYSAAVSYYIARISGVLGKLQDSLTMADLWSSTDLIVLSDHGQLAVRLESTAHFIDDFLHDPSILEASANDGAFMMLFPVAGKEYQMYQELYGKIPNVSIYTADDLESKPFWYYSSASHLSPLILLADPGFGVYRRNRFQSFAELPLSLHGYDNELRAMRGIFYARGIDFKPGYLTDMLNMVDIYQLVCHILILHCHEHDGSWERVSGMLVHEGDPLFAQRRSSADHFLRNQLFPSLVVVLGCLLFAHFGLRIVCSARLVQ